MIIRAQNLANYLHVTEIESTEFNLNQIQLIQQKLTAPYNSIQHTNFIKQVIHLQTLEIQPKNTIFHKPTVRKQETGTTLTTLIPYDPHRQWQIEAHQVVYQLRRFACLHVEPKLVFLQSCFKEIVGV